MSLIYYVKKNYEHFPKWAMDAASWFYYQIPTAKRYGKTFENTMSYLQDTEYMSRDEIDTLVNERFRYIVRYAGEHVPYYKKKFAEYGVDIRTIQDVRDIARLPLIDKEELRQHQLEMISDEYEPSKMMYITTSGSTGNPVGFYQKKSILMTEWAYVMHIWRRTGCRPDSIRLVLRGKKLPPQRQDPNWFYDPLRRELNCDVMNMTEENLEKYCCAIEKYRPQFIHGYMSAIMLLSKYIAARNGGLDHQFSGVLAISENVVPEQKAYVERVLGTRVFSFYGHSERLAIVGECEKSSSYHVEPSYGYCELLDRDRKPALEGEITATGFLNEAMPLIRYRTGDLAAWDDSGACPCGREHRRLAYVAGRWNQDMLVTLDGAYVSLAAINIHSDEFDHIVRYKFSQCEPGVVDMLIIPGKSYQERNGERIKSMLENKVNNRIHFNIELVDDLPVMKNGKYRIIEQKLPLSFDSGGVILSVVFIHVRNLEKEVPVA